MRYLEKLKQHKHSGGMEGAVNPPYPPEKKVKSIPGYELTSPTSFLGPATVGPVADVLPTPIPGHEDGQAPAVSTPTPSDPIPWHDATPDDRAEIRAALFEGLPVQIYSKVLGEIVWWALDDDVARKLKGGEFVKQGYPPYHGEAIYVWSELLAVIGLPPDALKNLHAFKKAFDARISKPRVICSACQNLAASYHHCTVRRELVIANPDNPIECDSYRPR
jgi:hypothetical protein